MADRAAVETTRPPLFSCGIDRIDEFIRKEARQVQEKGVSSTFVLVAADAESGPVIGYYTLAIAAIEFETIPIDIAKRLPRYPVPVIRLAMLGVHKDFQGQGLGRRLLVNALERALDISRNAGGFAVELDAINEEAKRFYLKYGFRSLQDNALHLFVPMKQVAKLFGDK